MNIIIPKNQSFLRKTLATTRGVLKGTRRSALRKIEIRSLLEELQYTAQENRRKQLKKAEVIVFSGPTSYVPAEKPIPEPQVEVKLVEKPAPEVQAEKKLKPILPRLPKLPKLWSKRDQKPPKTKVRAKILDWRKLLFVFLILSSILLIVVLFGPALYYKVFPGDPVPEIATETGTPLGGRFDTGTQQRTVPLPPYDDTLPNGNWLIIPRIGVRTELQENANSEVALEKGVWRVPDFGMPGELDKPMILAAHRFGYIWWWKNGSQYWRYNSFYLLPQTQPGDLVEVISGKRKYIYEIYAGEEGTDITDYNADLILYTCKFLTGDTRYFRYARLVDPTKYTQGEDLSTLLATPSAKLATPSAAVKNAQ